MASTERYQTSTSTIKRLFGNTTQADSVACKKRSPNSLTPGPHQFGNKVERCFDIVETFDMLLVWTGLKPSD